MNMKKFLENLGDFSSLFEEYSVKYSVWSVLSILLVWSHFKNNEIGAGILKHCIQDTHFCSFTVYI